MKIKSQALLSIAFCSSISMIANASNFETSFVGEKLQLAQADPHAGHDMGGSSSVNKAKAKGTLHRIDESSKSVNITHDPIPELGWPKMTMDLSTSKRVKLKNFKEGDVVEFEIKKGRDNMFRIIKMKSVK